MKLLYSNKSESINQSISPWSSLSPIFPFFSFSFGGLTFGLIGRKTLRFWPFFRQLAVTSLAQTRYTLHRHFPEKHPSKRQTAHKTCPLLFLSYSSTVYMADISPPGSGLIHLSSIYDRTIKGRPGAVNQLSPFPSGNSQRTLLSVLLSHLRFVEMTSQLVFSDRHTKQRWRTHRRMLRWKS